jgi:hypothetical protein
MKYCVNEPRVAHQTLDNETIIIDFETGIYYSARSEAVLIWKAICEGYSLEIISEFIATHSMNESQMIFEQVKEFVSFLLDRKLIFEVMNGQNSSELSSTIPYSFFTNPEVLAKGFSQPVLEIHSDMQELLLLDPVHDINGKGWPNKK